LAAEEASGRSPLHDVKEVSQAAFAAGGISALGKSVRVRFWSYRASRYLRTVSSYRASRCFADRCARVGGRPVAHSTKLVEPDGIEATTCCLQSRRSPN